MHVYHPRDPILQVQAVLNHARTTTGGAEPETWFEPFGDYAYDWDSQSEVRAPNGRTLACELPAPTAAPWPASYLRAAPDESLAPPTPRKCMHTQYGSDTMCTCMRTPPRADNSPKACGCCPLLTHLSLTPYMVQVLTLVMPHDSVSMAGAPPPDGAIRSMQHYSTQQQV